MKLNSRFIVSFSFLLDVALYKFSAPALEDNFSVSKHFSLVLSIEK